MGEIESLATRYGEPLRWSRSFDVSLDYALEWAEKTKERVSEVVLVMPRPGERVLLHTKEIYPPNTYRLMTGGIHFGEDVDIAARREMREETGLDVALERFLGLIEYQFQNDAQRVRFTSYIFLTEETRAQPHLNDKFESISEFRELGWNELARVADHLENLAEDWRDWGKFRAVAHRLVFDLRFQTEGPFGISDWLPPSQSANRES